MFEKNILEMKRIGLVLLVAFGGFAQAQTIVSDRPTQAVSSSIIATGSIQVEGGVGAGFVPEGLKNRNQILAPTVLVRYGLSDYFELRMKTQFESHSSPLDLKRTSGMADLQIGTKIRLLDKEDSDTKVAWLTQVVIPTGSRGISEDIFKGINRLSISHVITESINLGYNFGFNYRPDINGDLTYAVPLKVAVSKKVSFYVEPYGQYRRLLEVEANLGGGLTYLLKDNVQFDFSFGTGLNHKMNYLAAGFSWNVVKQ